MTHKDPMDNAMRAINRIYGDMVGRQANYLYYENKKTKDRFFYTTKKINHKGSPKFVAGTYRYLKTKKVFKMVKKVGFGKKKRAIAWALKEYNKSMVCPHKELKPLWQYDKVSGEIVEANRYKCIECNTIVQTF